MPYDASAQADRRWTLHYFIEADVEQTVLGQAYQPRVQELGLDYWLDIGVKLGWRHAFLAVDLPAVNGVAPDANGFLHRTGPTWLQISPYRIIRVEPRLAVSSNALRNQDLDLQDLSVLAAFEQRFAGTASKALWLSLHVDDRFGITHLYPGLKVQLASGRGAELIVGFPDSFLRWRWSQHLRSEVWVGPEGAKWRVRDSELERHSDVRLRSWTVSWITDWRFTEALALDFGVGWRFDTDLRYQLQDGSSAYVDVPNTAFLGLGARVKF